jgi:AhpD family alkylhydroperoxidase
MRLTEVERGDSLRTRALIRLISTVSGQRLPDAARVAFYHKDFAGGALGQWTHQAMRGPSDWTIGERELMAAMVAHWNSSRFCLRAHRAVAVRGGVDPAVVNACLADYHTAAISEPLRATLSFLETTTLRPRELSASDAANAMSAGVSRVQLAEAAAVAAVFNIITRYADALDFTIPTDAEFNKAAGMLLKRGYR